MSASPKVLLVALMAATVPWFAAPASAAPISSLAGVHQAAAPTAELVRYRGGGGGFRGGWHGGGGFRGGRGVGVGAGLVAGAIIGGAIAGTQPYGYGYGGYAPGYDAGYDDDYVAVAPGGGGGDAYCQQRFRSYDPASGTYLGYDGLRHPCG